MLVFRVSPDMTLERGGWAGGTKHEVRFAVEVELMLKVIGMTERTKTVRRSVNFILD